MRLNPKVRSRVNRQLLVLALTLLWNFACKLKPPAGYYKQKGRKAGDWRVKFCLCVLRVVLIKNYDQYEAEMVTDLRLLQFFGVLNLPSRSNIHRFTQLMTAAYIRRCMQELVRPYASGVVDLLLDATGISLMSRSIWYNLRTGTKIMKRDCYKLHAAISLRWGLIHNWRISNGKRHECPFLISLLNPFRRLGLVLADAGYSSRKNLQYIVDKCGAPFIKFSKNATAKSKNYPAWKLQHYFYTTMRYVWDRIYAKRNRIENVFSVIKGVWGDSLHSHKKRRRMRELMLRLLAYNVRQIMYIQYSRENNLPLWVRA
ncbi:transposase [Patescibacteria group bacterium]|nr:transposase [Patescibacteria group bacterium]